MVRKFVSVPAEPTLANVRLRDFAAVLLDDGTGLALGAHKQDVLAIANRFGDEFTSPRAGL